MITLYTSMAVLTAVAAYVDARPIKSGEWVAFVGLCLFWPAAFLFALYCAISLRRSQG